MAQKSTKNSLKLWHKVKENRRRISGRTKCLDLAGVRKPSSNFERLSSQKYFSYMLQILGISRPTICLHCVQFLCWSGWNCGQYLSFDGICFFFGSPCICHFSRQLYNHWSLGSIIFSSTTCIWPKQCCKSKSNIYSRAKETLTLIFYLTKAETIDRFIWFKRSFNIWYVCQQHARNLIYKRRNNLWKYALKRGTPIKKSHN